MIYNYDFVIVGVEEQLESNDYGERTRMFYKALAKLNKYNVLIVCSPVFFIKRIKTGSISTKFKRIYSGFLYTLYEIELGVHLLTFNSLFPDRDSFISKLNKKIISKKLQVLLNDSKYILWLAKPMVKYLIDGLRYKYLIFDAIDNLMEHPQYSKKYKYIQRTYKELDDKSNLIVVASENQREQFKSKNIYLMRNAVDEIFFREIKYQKKWKSEKKIIGYAGSLQERINVEILKKISEQIEDIEILLVGPNISPNHFRDLYSCKNITFAGAVPFEEIPSYISIFDVGIVPHVISEFTNSMNPLKIFEYLACGISVITTPISGSEQFKDYVDICFDTVQFVDCIKNRLMNPREANLLKEVASQHSWRNRVLEIYEDKLKFVE